jgi:endoglycosylceramidase
MGTSSALRFLGSVALTSALAAQVAAEDLRAEGPYFRDEAGAVVLLRGLNVAGDAKVPPFRPVDDPALFDPFPGWGVNVARLLFTWEAFEPERGSYDETYFAYYLSLIDALEARGIWVIVDVHQDAFSRFTTDGCGEGMPAWAVSSAVKSVTPNNGQDCAGWGLKMILNGDMHRCWDDFYADTDGVRSRYLTLLELLAQRLAPHPAVIGYDMLNEPWGDEVKQVGPLFEDAARIIRAHDERAILFASPQALTSSGQDTKLPKPTFANFAYSPHYYDAAVIQISTWLGGSLKDPVERMANQAIAWDVPLLVGEFGAPGAGTNVAPYMDAFYLELDTRFLSGTQWSWVAHWDAEKKDGWNVEDFSIVDGQQMPRQTYRVRPYPARIAGEPLSFSSTPQPSPSVELSYRHDPALGDTRIFAPRDTVFGGEVRAEVEGDATCAYEFDRRHVRCSSEVAGDVHIRLKGCFPPEPCLPVDEPPPGSPDAGVEGPPHGDGDAPGDGDHTPVADGGVDAGVATSEPPGAVIHKRGGCSASALPVSRAPGAFALAALAFAWRRRRWRA